MEILFILASSMAFDRLQVAFGQVGAELLESAIGDGGVEVDALKEGVDLDVGLGGGGQGCQEISSQVIRHGRMVENTETREEVTS